MVNKHPQIVTIDGNEYNVETLSDKAKIVIEHLADLDRKIGSVDFQRQQLQVGRDAFFLMLKQELPEPEPEEATDVATDSV